MTFEEWFEQNGDKTPFDDKELGAAWELIKYFWDEGYDQGIADSDPAVHVEDSNAGLPGMEDYTYEEFSRDCDRYDR